MNVIRPNWRQIRKLCIYLLFIYLIYILIRYVTFRYEPTLKYDSARREFLLNREWADLNNISVVEDAAKSELVRFRIKSALVRYTQVPVEYWINIIESALQLGLNTIELEIVWNAHEPKQKGFDFKTNSNDLSLFINLVKNYNLFLVIRMDPYYHCSDYDLGGLPSWLLADMSLEEREKAGGGLLNLNDKKFTTAFTKYLRSFLLLIAANQVVFDGPIIGVAVAFYEPNELISNDLTRFYNRDYVDFIAALLDSYNIVETVLKSINACESNAMEQIMPDAHVKCDPNLRVYSPVYHHERVSVKQKFKKQFILKNMMQNDCSESKLKYWSSTPNDQLKSSLYFDENHRTDLTAYKSSLITLINNHKSFSINNFFCNLNLDFTQGSHHLGSNHSLLLPISTHSLQSNCVLSEERQTTDKFLLSKQILKDRVNLKSILIQEEKNFRKWSEVRINEEIKLEMSHFLNYKNFSKLLPNQLFWRKKNELYFEFVSSQMLTEVHKSIGYMLYRLENLLTRNTVVYINTRHIRDYALVTCNSNETLLRLDNVSPGAKLPDVVKLVLTNNCEQFDVLVENVGRLSDISSGFNTFSHQRKGILTKSSIQFKLPHKRRVKIGNRDWKVFFIDFNKKHLHRVYLNSHWLPAPSSLQLMNLHLPIMTFTRFNVDKVANTLLDEQNGSTRKAVFHQGVYLVLPAASWSKGAAFINNFNVGRYWSSVGPLCSIFIPEHLLYDGVNELMIFDIHKPSRESLVYLTDSHIIL